MINVILIARPSVLQIGIAHSLRASSSIHLAACVDRLDLLPTVINGLLWHVLLFMPAQDEVVPGIMRQAANVVCLTPSGSLRGIQASDLPAQTLEEAVVLAAAHGQTQTKADNSAVISAALSANSSLKSHTVRQAATALKIALTHHQKEVLTLLVKGLTNGEIAKALGVSLPTARYHVSAILTKLDVSNRTEASSMAINLNLIDTPNR